MTQVLEIEGGPTIQGEVKYFPDVVRLSRQENRN